MRLLERWKAVRAAAAQPGGAAPRPLMTPDPREKSLTALEREFLPPLLAIQESPPSPVGRWLAWTLIVLVIALIVWASVGRISIVATAPGKFIPEGRLKEVQPLESSIVRAIDVTDGEHVRKGQVLIRLDPTLNAAQLRTDAEKVAFNRLEQARITSELTGKAVNLAALDPRGPDLLLEQHVRQAQEQDYATRLAGARAAVAAKSAALAADQATLQKYEKLTTLAASRAASAQPLVPIGAISRDDYLKLEEDLVQDRDSAASEQRTVEEDRAALTGVIQALAQVRRDHVQDLYHDLAERAADEPALQGAYAKSKDLYDLEWLRSPVNGVVQSVNVTTNGQVVTPAQSLVTLVPDGTPLIVEATVSNNDIGYLRVGQKVQVKVDTFPFMKYGTLPGTLVWISPDAEDRAAVARDIDMRTGALSATPARAEGHDLNAGFVYRVHIRVAHAEFLVNGQRRSVEPGMTVEADIQTGRRRVIAFFLDPVIKYMNQGVRVR